VRQLVIKVLNCVDVLTLPGCWFRAVIFTDKQNRPRFPKGTTTGSNSNTASSKETFKILSATQVPLNNAYKFHICIDCLLLHP